MERAHILVAEDDRAQREQLADFLRDLELDVEEVSRGDEALRKVESADFDLVIADLRMPGLDGDRLLREVRSINPEIPFVLVTAYGTVKSAVESLRQGAANYLLKPLELDEVEHVVRVSLERRRLQDENRELRRRLSEIESIDGIVTAGGEMAGVLSQVARVAASTISVLILGESGTGKELIARAIHAASPRSDGPFVAVSATALSPTLLESELFGHEKGAFTGADREHQGRFESAAGGTLFLDEIGDLPPEVQVKLLRALQERTIERVGSNRAIEIDVRIVSASHHDLLALLREGSFREDLYYRLAVVTISLPPLRKRRTDIPVLIDHFLSKHASLVDDPPLRCTREALDLLVRYDYPGNVRELENIVQRGLVLARGDRITLDDLPQAVIGGGNANKAAEPLDGESLPARVAALERAAIQEALEAADGNQSRAARRLGISERALRYKRAKYQGDSR